MIEAVQNNFQNTNNIRTGKYNTYSEKYYFKPYSSGSKANEIITLEEGIHILGKGISGQCRDTINSIIKNPVKTLIGIMGITVGMTLLPFIGVSTAVGGSVLALGFAAIATGKAVYHAVEFSKSYKDGACDIARNNLEQVGRDSFDIAISAPFVPKALSVTKKFVKYGKIQINKDLFGRISKEKSLTGMYGALMEGDTYLYRHINFQKAVDRELAMISDMTDAEKLKIKNELISFSVPEKDIPMQVLIKMGKKDGVTTLPDIGYTSMSKNTQGYASQSNCSIMLNDFKRPYIKDTIDNLVMVQKRVENGVIRAKFRDIKTGQIYDETIDITLLNEYNSRCESYKRLSPQAKRILTTLHEREHIMQFARLIQLKGFGIMRNLTARGKELYKEIISQMPAVESASREAIEAESLASFNMNPTIFNYIKRPFEIGARRAEYSVIDDSIFKKLNTIFEYTNKYAKSSIEKTIFMTDARYESVKN